MRCYHNIPGEPSKLSHPSPFQAHPDVGLLDDSRAVVPNLPMLRPLTMAHHIVVTPSHKMISLLLCYYNFATVRNL